MKRGFAAAMGILMWLGQAPAWAGQAELSVRWSELSRAVGKNKVALVLPDGTHIQGKVRSVETDGLRMRVSKTTDRLVMAKGDVLIPRKSVSLVQVTDYRKLGRILCTLGAVGASAIAVGANDIDIYEGPALIAVPAMIALGTAGMGVAGYFIGKRIDKRVVNIRIVPE